MIEEEKEDVLIRPVAGKIIGKYPEEFFKERRQQ